MGGVYDSTKPGNPKYVKAKINIIFCKNFRKLINVNFDFIHLNLCVEKFKNNLVVKGFSRLSHYSTINFFVFKCKNLVLDLVHFKQSKQQTKTTKENKHVK